MCKVRESKPERKNCQRCIDLAGARKRLWESRNPREAKERARSRRYAYNKARYEIALAKGFCSSCLQRPATLGVTRCGQCTEADSKRRKKERERRAFDERLYAFKDYVPADVWLARRRNQVMRILRRRDWTTAEDVADLLGVPNGSYCTSGDDRERGVISTTISRLYRAGLLERRQFSRSFPMEYRVVSGLPDSVFEPPLDSEVIGDSMEAA